eukprot:GHVU01154079.1.p1 GENE.GHVU01154079.1~~GHVU01154079.1.p1  ORF type:complete len:249 (+),score=37.62 GHVU01154079.1:82-747(+)
MVKNLVVSKTAEALRRRAAEQLTLGVAVHGAVLNGVISDPARDCTCKEDAETALSTATPLPRQNDSPELNSAILQILDTMRVEGIVDLHDYPLARYNQTEMEDRQEVEKVQAEGRDNPSARQVLVINACLHPQQTAERRIKESCPSLAASPSTSRVAPCTPKAVPAMERIPVRREGGVTSEPMEVTPVDDCEKKEDTASSCRQGEWQRFPPSPRGELGGGR